MQAHQRHRHEPTISVKQSLLRLCLVLIVGFWLHPVQAQTGIVDRVLNRYAGMETMQARFRQVMTSQVFDEPQTVSGSLYLKGAAYRILTGSRTIVTDGLSTWIFDPGENQVLIDDYLEDESTLSVHQILYRFNERFQVAGAVRTGESWRVALSPRDPDDYFRSVEFIVRDSDALITQIEVEDANDVHLSITLTDVRQNPPLDDALFRFDAPEGVEVVDLRAG